MGHPDFVLGSITAHSVDNSSYLFKTSNGCSFIVLVLTDDIVRLRYAPDGVFENDFSYAISSKFVAADTDHKLTDAAGHIEITTGTMIVNVNKSDSNITFTTLDKKIICREEKGFHWEDNTQYGGHFVKMSKVVQEGEHFYGMGDKPMHLNLRGKRVVNWAMDTYGFKKDEDPIYKGIPFYTAIHHHQAYGIFFDNTFKGHFDFASERRSVMSFWADGGEMNYYFINGPQLIDVTRRYSMLTGTPEMPPMWSLGYQQSRWSYYPEAKVREVTTKIRELAIPCDGFYFDIDYMDGFRCFTWDIEKFPDPKTLVKDLKDQGYKAIVIIDPGIKVDDNYPIYQEALKENHFCRRADGPYMKGKVWPGDCYFPDFTSPKVRKWWSGLFEELIENQGIRGVWNDMNEPALFEIDGKTFPADVRHDYDGNPCSHRKAHNIYGMQMARATFKGVKKHLNGLRPLVITRSAYAGTQRYASAWTGDNIASWEHLWVANVQCQRMSISGYSFVGSDIGGFIDHPTPELYIRWMQLAAFHPFFRTHSSGDHGDQEPWSFGEEALNIVRSFIELRYQLLPYLYSTFHQYVSAFTPILRPISIYDQEDSDTLYRSDEFLHGDHILICPVLEPNVTARYVYIPKGTWYSYWDDLEIVGGVEIKADAPLDRVPLFIRAGAVIPMFPVMQYVGQRNIEQLTLHIYYGGDEVVSKLYEDEGDGYQYEKGIYNVKTFKSFAKEKSFLVDLKSKGHYEPNYSTYKIVLHGIPYARSSYYVNDKILGYEKVSFEGKNPVIIIERTSFISLEVVSI